MNRSEAIQLPAARRNSRTIEASVLLLLSESEGAYGYELKDGIEELALTEAKTDTSAVYRCLRWLEEHEQVRSEWDTRGQGPARRRYQLTDLGIKSLTLWADLLKRRRAALDGYLDRYRKAISRIRRVRRV
jgi:DNA-binding PadR family transcriptional regulator